MVTGGEGSDGGANACGAAAGDTRRHRLASGHAAALGAYRRTIAKGAAMGVRKHQGCRAATGRGMRAKAALVGACLAAAAVVPLAGTATAAQRPHADKNPLHLVTPGSLTVVAQSDQLPFDGIVNHAEVGFDIALDRALAKDLGLKITFHDQDFAGILPALNAHEYDFGAMALMWTTARAQEVTFSQPFYYGGLSVLVKRSSGLTKDSAFAGKRVGVLLGSTQAAEATERLGSAIQEVTFENENEAVAALEGDQVDAVFIGYANTAPFIEQYPDLQVAKFWLVPSPNDIPVAKGDTALVRALNRALDHLFVNGTYAKLYHKWLPGPISHLLISAHKHFKGY